MVSTLKCFVKNVFLLLSIVLILMDAVDCAGGSQYSIYSPFLKHQENADKQIRSQNINKGIETPEAVVANNLANDQKFHPRRSEIRFSDNGDGTVTDRTTNLMWLKNGRRLDFVSAVTWRDAVKKSKEINIAGYDNWRLPTIEEWNSLIDTDHQHPALVEPNPFKNIVTHMPYWSMTEFVYGKDHTCGKVCPLDAYTVMLYSGRINHQKKNLRAFILPVRSIDPSALNTDQY
ncbi:DUF1566 domain-containing protein [Thermodesulfobacteriota bacterium]